VRRASIIVPAADAEQARARLVELAPEGFEEVELGAAVELAAYGRAADRLASAFPDARIADVEAGWENRWREFHRPVTIGPLWVGPPWEAPAAGTVPVVVDPGRAFGTGAHPTTRLCLELLLEQPTSSLLDVGCGSGVLAIAAAALGFEPVTAIDDDPAAVEATERNAAANGVRVEVLLLDALAGTLPAAGLTLANVSLEAVNALRPTGDRLVTSGYLVRDAPRVVGWTPVRRLTRDGWAADLHEKTA
jgi:ribosomal protein L11 methyltransferase